MAAWPPRDLNLRRPPTLLLTTAVAAAIGGVALLTWPSAGPPVEVLPESAPAEGPPTRGPAAVHGPATPRDEPPETAPAPDATSSVPAIRWVVSGHVLAADTRAPIADATLGRGSVRRPESLGPTEGFDPSPPTLARSDAAGAFRFELEAGPPVEVVVDHPAWRRARVTIDGSRTDELILLQPGLAVAGRVVGRDGGPLEGARVRHRVADGGGGGEGREGVELTTDRDGRFRLVVDPKAPGSLTVSHPGHVRRTLRLEAAATRDVVVVLAPALVTWLRLRPADGRAIPSARVIWASGPRSGTEVVGGVAPGRDAAAGPPDHVGPLDLPLDEVGTPISLHVMVPGYLPFTTELTPHTPDGEERRLDVPLERDPDTGAVALRVEAEDGSPVAFDAALPVTVERTDGGATPTFAIAAGDGGGWALDGLPAGRYRLRVWPARRGPADAEVVVVAGTTVGVTARAPAEARVRVRVSGTKGRRAFVRILSGGRATFPSVVDDPRGTARTARVAVSGIDSVVVLVGEEGVTLGGLGAGPHRVELVSPDVVAPPLEVELTPGETVAAEVVGATR